jgi:predicted ATPase
MPSKVFISYRRDDSKYQARMIHEAFCRVLPQEHVFMDIASIPPGSNFRKILSGWVNECEVLLALVGREWIDATDPKTSRRRLDNPSDFVRMEIGEALARGIPVVPVLIDGTPMPDVDSLPDDLKDLVDRQAEFVEYRTFDADIERLIKKLRLTQRPAPSALVQPVLAPPPTTTEDDRMHAKGRMVKLVGPVAPSSVAAAAAIEGMDELKLGDYTVAGGCVCFDPVSRSHLKTLADRISAGLKQKTNVSETFLLWGSSGSGKTFLIKQIAADMGSAIEFVDVDLSSVTEEQLKAGVTTIRNAVKPVLALFDEVDARETETWIYPEIFKLFEINFTDSVKQAVFVLVGSGGGSKQGLMKRIRTTERGQERARGDDLVNRVHAQNQEELPDLTLQDRITILASQIITIGREQKGFKITEIDKLALYYLLTNRELTKPRHYELVIRSAVARLIDPDVARFRHEDLFDRYDQNIRRFWEENGVVAARLQHKYIRIRV